MISTKYNDTNIIYSKNINRFEAINEADSTVERTTLSLKLKWRIADNMF